jgi:protein PET117
MYPSPYCSLTGSSFSPALFPEPLRKCRADPVQAMHAGVLRDMEQQRIKKERQLDFEMQRALEEEYRKVQHVHDGGGLEVAEKRPS